MNIWTRFIGLMTLLAFCLALFGESAFGQTAQITGRITDRTQAAVPGADITVLNVDTGIRRLAVSQETGYYVVPLLPPGNYEITVQMPGFRPVTRRGIILTTQEALRVDVVLEVGEITDSINVVAPEVSLRTEDATVGEVVDRKRIDELPLQGRNLSQLGTLIPGVQYGTYSGSMATGLGGFPITGANVSLIANGQREINSPIMLDGVDAREQRTHVMVFAPSIEAVQEFKVQTGSYSAEFGQGGGAQVQITMKSGTNRFKGTLFEFLRNDRLDAEDYFLNFGRPGEHVPKDRLRRNQFGGVLSGPVYIPGLYDRRNRTFWAFNYEGRRETNEGLQQAWYPNQDFRSGDFSALLKPATNPTTGKPFRNPIVIYDPISGDPFPNNIIPKERLHPGAVNMLQFFPEPQFERPDILDINASAAVPQVIRQNQYYMRLDHRFSEADDIFVRLAVDRSRRTDENLNPHFPNFFTSNSENLATQWLHTFSPTTLNHFRFGLNSVDVGRTNPRTNTDFDPDTLGIGKYRVYSDNRRRVTPLETGIPQITTFDIGDQVGGFDDNTSYQFANHTTLVRKQHTFKAGLEYRHIDQWRAAGNLPVGRLTFGSLQSGHPFASFLLGFPSNATTGEGLPDATPRMHRFGAYFLDEWKATPRLSLNLGIRWDYFGIPVDRSGHLRTLSFVETENVPDIGSVPKIIPPGRPSPAGAIPLWEDVPSTFQPRVGIAFRATDKWVIRTGAGYFANTQRMQTYTLFNLMPPLSGSETFTSVTNIARRIEVGGVTVQTRRFRPGTNILSLSDPFPEALLGTRAARTNLLMVPPDHKQSTHVQWSLDLQRRLPFSTVLTVGYVGSKTSHIANNYRDINAPGPSPDTDINARRPYQWYFDDGLKSLGNIRFLDSNGNGFYQGLQVNLQKRYSHGIAYGLAYTYSKAHGEGEAGGNEFMNLQNPSDRRAFRGRYAFDLRHNMVFHALWELPFFKNVGGLTSHILSGWQMNAILRLTTGFPFTVTQGSDLNTGINVLPDRIADGRLSSDKRTREMWFDPLAFQRVTCRNPDRPDLCRYGNSGKGIIESPGQQNLDLSLFKNFRPRGDDKYMLQFRVEAFNATNTPYFDQPRGISFVGADAIVPNGPAMGEIRSLRAPMRIIQFGLKLYF